MLYQTDINNNKKPNNSNQQQSVYLMFGDDEQHHSQNDLCSLENNQSKLSWQSEKVKKNTTLNKINQSSSAVVPNLTNVDEIFYLLSQKIAKYCQILSDLTNCEVFYKAYLPLNNTNKNELNTKSKKLNNNNYNNSKNNPSSSTISTTKQLRSLYWGTHQMLFQFSHDQGIKYNKQSGDSLIKLNNRSISTDINQLIEEILNAPSTSSSTVTNENNKEQTIDSNIQTPKLINKELINKSQTNEIKLKDCCIYLNKLDDNENVTIDHYFNKFELKHNNLETGFMIGQDIIDENNNNKSLSLNELPSDSELYSDQYIVNFNGKKSSQHANNNTDSEDENDDDDEDEKALLEKNCLNNNDINENDENYYRCEQCPSGYSYKHLTQLKVHQLRAHFNIDLNNKTCQKCNHSSSGQFASQIEFLKHSITCYFPNAYQCKTCSQIYENYSQYLFHIRYIHTHVVYMCSICNRKYKHIKDLIDHDQLMHSKSLNYCEICFESFRSRKYLYEHYKKSHLNKHEKEILIINELESDDNDDDDNEDEDNDSIEHERIQKPNNQMITKEFQLDDNDNDDDDDESININDEDNEEEEHFTDKSNKKSATSSQNQPKVHKNELIRGLIDRKHQCKWCSLRFYTKSQLKQHENLHTNSVLNCPVCDKQFTSKDRLNGHMKCHMEPSLECKVCGKKFKRLCNLYNHELVHGLTEHAFMLCQFCGRGFRSRRDYQNHVIANHRDHLMKVDSEGTVIQELNNNNNLKRTRKTSKKVSSSANISNNSNSITNSTPSNENIQPSNDMIINDSTDDTYFTRTGVNFDLEDFQFDDEDEFNHLDEEYNLNDKQSNSINKKSINNKNKIKKFKMNNQIEVEEDYMSDQSQPQQINQTKANTSILANLFEESLN